MRALRIFSRNIRDSFYSVFRNFSLSMASIICITITLIVVSIFIILTMNVSNFTKLVEGDVTIVAFLDVDASDEEVEIIKQKIEQLDNIDSFEYKSKQEIANDMMAEDETFASIMGDWTEEENPLNPTVQIKATEIEFVESIAKDIEKMDNVDEVQWGEEMVDSLISVFETVRQVCFYTVIALVVVTAFLITNTIKITILARKREIDIMRLVGASNINIKIPFIFEGLFLGIFGAILPILVTVFGYQELYTNFNGQLFSPFIKLIEPEPFVYGLSILLLGLGILVGMFGSYTAVRKHLKI